MTVKDYRALQWVFSSSSSGGQYLKSEQVLNGKKYYYKLSDYSYGSFMSHESVLEVIVSRLGVLLGFPVLKYTGCMADIYLDGKIRRTFVSKSLNYCGSEQTAMSLMVYYQLNKIGNELPLDFCRRMGFIEFTNMLFIFDYLIMNLDRHGRNIEVLVSNKGVSLAPIFDNGRCLTAFCGNNIESIRRFDYTLAGQANNFLGGINLERNLNYVTRQYKLPRLTPSIKRQIFYGLSGVLSAEHMDIIWKALNYRYSVLVKRGIIA